MEGHAWVARGMAEGSFPRSIKPHFAAVSAEKKRINKSIALRLSATGLNNAV
jgi:hypothetical protein